LAANQRTVMDAVWNALCVRQKRDREQSGSKHACDQPKAFTKRREFTIAIAGVAA
jgi:hypothetical protein